MQMMSRPSKAIESPVLQSESPKEALKRERRSLFRYSRWDAIPVLMLVAHLALLVFYILSWDGLTWPMRVLGGVAYAFCIGWSLDSVAHNFIHNAFFRSKFLNRASSIGLTLANGVPQTMYHFVHMKHHAGNSDYPNADGATLDPISIYQFGEGGKAEPMLSYVFLQFWRDDGPFTVARQIRAKRPREAAEALHEFWILVAVYGAAAIVNWRAVLFLVPFYYLGQCLTALIAYYEHLGGDPKTKVAWGVSTYAPIYNWMFLNNGYHAEHHFRPKAHWSAMKDVRREIGHEIQVRGLRVLRPAHWLGFLDSTSWTVPTASRRKNQ